MSLQEMDSLSNGMDVLRFPFEGRVVRHFLTTVERGV